MRPSRPPAPRLAGRRLLALARLLRTPVAGSRIAELAIRELLITPLRRRVADDPELRAVIPYRAMPRRPE